MRVGILSHEGHGDKGEEQHPSNPEGCCNQMGPNQNNVKEIHCRDCSGIAPYSPQHEESLLRRDIHVAMTKPSHPLHFNQLPVFEEKMAACPNIYFPRRQADKVRVHAPLISMPTKNPLTIEYCVTVEQAARRWMGLYSPCQIGLVEVNCMTMRTSHSWLSLRTKNDYFEMKQKTDLR